MSWVYLGRDLSSNRKLSGKLPPELGNLTSLQRLFLQNCDFSGTIPPELGDLKNLTFLGLNQNSLTGSIPGRIGQLTELVWLDVSTNKLSGKLPDSTTGGGLDTLTSAKHFHLQNNSFSGSIPSTIFNPEMQLLHLLLHDNSFSGPIPPEIGSLTHIDILRLDSNKLTGPIPDTISNLTSLSTLQLNSNELSGQLPDLSSMTHLQVLDVSNNQFEPAEIPSWMATVKSMQMLSMQAGNWIGEVPADIFKLSAISNVTLALNKLNGTLDLRNVPSSLINVEVQDNSISILEKGDYAQDLNLDGNPVCNDNPDDCTQSAKLPPLITSLDCGCSDPYAQNPKAFVGCMCSLPVKGNIEFSAFKVPILSNFIGEMEEQFAEVLRKNLLGHGLQLTKDQVVLHFFSTTEAVISIFPPSSMMSWKPDDAVYISYVLKNQDVEFPDLGPYQCQFYPNPLESMAGGFSTGGKIGIGIGAAGFLIVILVVGAYATAQKRRADRAVQQSKPFASWMASGRENVDIPQLKGARWFSFAEIKKATDNFNENNEIGAGGYGKVYKGFLLCGDRVAIKRAQANSLQGAAEFKNEIELLSRVHHKNLVGLIGFCFEEGEQMLVYEYMPNGNMRDCLSGQSRLRMDWERRVALALGSARGLAYLHTEAHPPIIHRDVKSTNILLDEKLVAKVADFGLSKLAPDGHVVTQVKGTLGYLDPDYYMTHRLTGKSDVYSFGVVLLELITARKPIQQGKFIVREVRTALDKGGMACLQSLLDPHLTQYPPKAMESFVSIALSCVEEESRARPTMGEVVNKLEALARKSGAMQEIEYMGHDRSELYAEGSPYLQKGTSFEYSGGYGMPTTVEPK